MLPRCSFFVEFAVTENFILASMVYDHHAKTCKSLHYTTIQTSITCVLMIYVSYICGPIKPCIDVVFIFCLFFCYSNVINHFFCDFSPLFVISFSDSYKNTLVSCVVFSILVILNTYLLIFLAIQSMNWFKDQNRVFYTCASHLITVSIFFGAVIFIYLQPSSNLSLDTDKVVSEFYTMVILMLNPLVYGLRNKEVKGALNKFFGKANSSQVLDR